MPLRLRAARLLDASGSVGEGGARAGSARPSERRGLLLRLDDDAGAWGQGEASPLPGYSTDTLEACRAELAAADWSRVSIDEDRPVEELLAALAPLGLSAAAACFAAETAVLDLVGKRRGVPVSSLLRGGAAPAAVALSELLPDGPPAAVAAAVEGALARGVRTVKLKVGRPGGLAGELAVARAARAALGSGALRLDANRGWSPAEAGEALAAFAPLDIEVVEEPVARWRELPRPAPARIAADESLQAPGAEAELAERVAAGACHALVLKPMALGGFSRCLALARAGRRLGLGLFVTHLFDGPVGLAAAAELALALDDPWACGLSRHPGLSAWPAAPPPQIGAAAIAPVAAGGLGLPDLAALLEAR